MATTSRAPSSGQQVGTGRITLLRIEPEGAHTHDASLPDRRVLIVISTPSRNYRGLARLTAHEADKLEELFEKQCDVGFMINWATPISLMMLVEPLGGLPGFQLSPHRALR